MKGLKTVLMMVFALTLNCIFGGTVAMAAGLPPAVGAIGLNAVAAVFGPATDVAGILKAGVYTEVWTGEMIKPLRAGLEASWLAGVPDASSLVNNDVIHLVDVGVDPDVLINNTTYPIDLQNLDDADKAISLDKFQTKVTPITDDELYAISYDKMARVLESHRNAITDAELQKAAHALCASQNTDTTPVLTTSGDVDTTTGRVKMCMNDVINMKRQMDKLKVPATGRRLVLSTDHVNDLLETDQKFREQYNIDRANGTIGKLYGFEIYEFVNTPFYTSEGVKKDVGATGGDGEFQASFAYYVPRVFKATGSLKMYYSEAGTDPEYQRNKVNFRHYFICLPKKEDAGVVIYSGYQATASETATTSAGGTGTGADEGTEGEDGN